MFVTQIYEPYLDRGGPAFKVPAMALRMAQRGHRITVLTADLGNSSHLMVPDEPASSDDVTVIRLRSLFRYHTLTLNPGVIRFCRRHLVEFDIIHIFGLYDWLGPVVAFYARKSRIPYMVEPMGMARPMVRGLFRKRAYHMLMGRRLLRHAVCVIATSTLEGDDLQEMGVPAHRIVVRRNGIDPNEFRQLPRRGHFREQLGLHEDTPLLVFLGRISRKKGLDLMVEALARLPASVHLAVVGPDDGDGCLPLTKRKVTQLGLESRVHFVGPRYGRDRLAVFVDADVFVLPSRHENFGNAALEAMACGVPVVITDRCGIAQWTEDRAGFVVPAPDGTDGTRTVSALVQSVRKILDDEDLKHRLRAEARAIAGQLTWAEPIKLQARLYEFVVDNYLV